MRLLTIGGLPVFSLCFMLLALTACTEKPGQNGTSEVVAYTPKGGVVRFSGVLVGDVITKAQEICAKIGASAVPIGIYKIGMDTLGRDQLLTFECK